MNDIFFYLWLCIAFCICVGGLVCIVYLNIDDYRQTEEKLALCDNTSKGCNLYECKYNASKTPRYLQQENNCLLKQVNA